MKNWYQEWFASEEYLLVYKHRNLADAEKLINFILSNIELESNSRILDIACGAGRHSFLLSKKGFSVFGFDLSKPLLLEAKKEFSFQNIPSLFFQADIRNIPINKRFNLVLNLFTSFGYFDNDDENFSLFSSAFELLENNCWFVFDYFNESYLRNNLVPFSKNELSEDILVEQYRSITEEFVCKELIIKKAETEKRFLEKVKLYNYRIIIKKLKETGFTDFRIYGDYDGVQFNELSSPRLIVLAKK